MPESEKSQKQGDGPSRRKRARYAAVGDGDDTYISRLDVKLSIPDELKQWLVDDWELITRQKQLVPLPRKKAVCDILNEYVKHKQDENADGFKLGVTQEVANGIQEYFNVMLGTQLLYKFERPQYADLLTKHPDSVMSEIYGAEHLLRLFVKLGGALSFTSLDEKSVQFVMTHIHDCLDYLSKKTENLFTTEYETATPEYHRRAAT